MNVTSSLSLLARRALGRNIQRLTVSLEHLTHRVRETIAEAVAQSVAEVIHETVQALLAHFTQPVTPPPRPNWTPDPAPAWWHDDDEQRPDAIDEDAWPALPGAASGWANPGESLPQVPILHEPAALAPRWRWPVILGCQAAAWWLQRRAQEASLLALAGVGLSTAAVAYLAGPGLLFASLRLLGMAGAVHSGSAALTALGGF